jgi:aerobic C4-dicarboxylate transport protein
VTAAITKNRQPFYRSLVFQVLLGITAGILFGYLSPARATAMRPIGDGFIKLIKMLIGPIVFSTVVVGIAQMGRMKDVGRIGLRALVYFEIVSTLALVIGMVVATVLKPGSGLLINVGDADVQAIASYTTASQKLSTTEFLMNIIPNTVVDAFSRGDILQVLLFSILFGLALLGAGERVKPLVTLIDQLSHALFGIIELLMRLAPIGAFGAMAFTVGRFGIGSLVTLGLLLAGVYLTCALFIVVVLGGIVRLAGLSLWKLVRYISEEILIVAGTASSETVLPRIIEKMEHLGCRKSVVGLVIPTGYSFNLDGTAIYMTMATLFMAQVSGVHLSLGETLSILGLLLLTSKGAAAVTGGGFITLAATLSAIPAIPVAGLALLVGVDRFMSTARALTNLIGNAVATVVVARWDGALDMDRARIVLNGGFDDARVEDTLVPVSDQPVFVARTYAPSERS